MDYRAVFQIAAAGMDLEKRRLDVAALNLANLHASAAPGQSPVAVQKVVASPLHLAFVGAMQHQEGMQALRTIQVIASEGSPRLAHDPGHPHANAQGMVAYPAVDQATEMVTVSTALRAYEANVAVASTARSMAAKALELGGQS